MYWDNCYLVVHVVSSNGRLLKTDAVCEYPRPNAHQEELSQRRIRPGSRRYVMLSDRLAGRSITAG